MGITTTGAQGNFMVNLRVRSLTPHVGAEVQGVDLTRSLDDEIFEEILQALHAKAVLVFRGQRLDPQRQIDFSRRFGPLQTYAMDHYSVSGYRQITVVSNIVENDRRIGLHADEVEWHVDLALTSRPGSFTFLYCVEAATTGGDTLFAAAAAAYEALPNALQARLRDMQAVHSAHFYREERARRNQGKGSSGERDDPDPVHPIVRTHPVTGRKSLFLGPIKECRIIGLDDQESNALIQELIGHTTQDEFVYRHRWQAGDLVCWDNRSLIHTATPFDGERDRRLLYRTTVEGDGAA
jgi:taurine dioxygenase